MSARPAVWHSGISETIKAGVDSVEHASLIDDDGFKLVLAHGIDLVFDIYNDDYILSEGAKAGKAVRPRP